MTKAGSKAADSALRTPHSAFLRPTWAEIDAGAFLKNLSLLAGRLRPGARLMAVLKADGYGHGAVPLARAADGWAARGGPLWGFGVSSVEEGLAIRAAGISRPVLILGSLFPFDSFEAALENGLTPTVASRAAVQALGRAAARLKRPAAAHLKLDSGMGRIGVSPEGVEPALAEIRGSASLRLEGLYTHFAQAGDASAVGWQRQLFEAALARVRRDVSGVLGHAANSEALLRFPETHYDLARPGLALYGVYPQADLRGAAELSPVLAWKTRVVFLKTVPPGTAVSYGGTFRAGRTSRLATLPVGYADGYRRALSNKGRVLIKGRRCPVAGRVTMDQIVVDVTDVPEVDVGEEAVLIGAQGQDRITAEEMAAWADTIPYEILCGITARVPRVPKGMD